MKQGNPTKRFGLVALISAMISGLTSRPEGVTRMSTRGALRPIPRNRRARKKPNKDDKE